uniref:GRIP1 associated protein 1 n=1 Tax=Sphenodon punctatus TaxID=8508 RepID=A0A8D0GEK3_SPHPU
MNSLRQRVAFLDKEFAKAQKEVDALLSENEMLQGKLHSQEEDFRLQNSTLMQELSKLCSQIEQLEAENLTFRERDAAPANGVPPASPVDGEFLRLQAENTALQKNVAALQERYEKELARRLEGRGGGRGDVPLEPDGTRQEAEGADAGPTQTPQPLAEVELKLQTEREEKRLLRDQLQNLESLSALCVTLSPSPSFLRLQTEKEALYNDSRGERCVSGMSALQVPPVLTQCPLSPQSFSELKEQVQSRRKEHEVALQALQDQVGPLSPFSASRGSPPHAFPGWGRDPACRTMRRNGVALSRRNTRPHERERLNYRSSIDVKLKVKHGCDVENRQTQFISPSRAQTGDSSSVSSFSYREIMKEGSGPGSNKSTTGSPQSQSQQPRPADLSDEEISDLFQRLAEIQQEKWMLEEKVKHLEVSSSSMAEDLCRKSAIIETYVMDSRIDVSSAHGQVDRSSLSSVLRDLVKPGDENLREMNKKLQNMLEEQLTKNMHLQKVGGAWGAGCRSPDQEYAPGEKGAGLGKGWGLWRGGRAKSRFSPPVNAASCPRYLPWCHFPLASHQLLQRP